MKCESCGSSWESRQHLDKCPFCSSLLNKNLDLESNFSNTLKMVLNQYGVEILKEKKFISILKDYVPNETKKNELMNIFVTKDVGRKFVEMYFEKNNEWVNIYDYCVKCLKEDAFIGHEFACMIMDEIGATLNLTYQTQAYILDKKQAIKEISIDETPKINNDELLYGYLQEKETLRTKNLRECIELYTWHCGDMCFPLQKKIDNYWNTTFDIVILNENNEMYDDNIDVRTILKAIEFFIDKNNKSYSDPDKEQLGRFLFDESVKYRSLVKQAKNKEEKASQDVKSETAVVEHFYGTEETPISHFEIENGVLKKYNGKATQIVIPKSVTEIGDGAFFGNEQLRSAQYRPAQIKRIGGAAFFGCTKLSAINGLIGLRFGEGLEEIGSFAFQNCKSITSVSIPNSTKLIDGRAFYDCDNLESIIFDGNQVVIKSDAFKKCKNLRNIEIDEKLFAKYCDCFDGEWNLK